MPKLAGASDLPEKVVDTVIYGCTEEPKGEKSGKPLFFCLFTSRRTAWFEFALHSHWNFYSVTPFLWSFSREIQLQRTSLSLSLIPLSPMKEQHYLPLVCNLLETIIFTSVYHISTQKPILIFHTVLQWQLRAIKALQISWGKNGTCIRFNTGNNIIPVL